MPGYELTSFLLYAFINAFTPGPSNILALNTVTNYGWKNGRNQFLGIFVGYYSVLIICGLFVYGVGAFLPKTLGVVKYFGAVYILWLAIHVAMSNPNIVDTEKSKPTFIRGFMLQFVNVKVYMYGITALAGFIVPYSTKFMVLCGVEFLLATIGTVATIVWIGMGLLISRFYLKHYRIINIILALSLGECIWSMLK